METLVVVDRYRNEYYSRGRGHRLMRFDSFDSPPTKQFRAINCRTFQAGSGILPTPLLRSTSPPLSSPKTPVVKKLSKSVSKSVKSSPVPIPPQLKVDASSRKSGSFNGDLSFSERWAGPTYSNSPPPSSLPIPKFSVVRPSRTVSLNLPTAASEIDFHPVAKSAPVSPTRERSPSPMDFSDNGASSASKAFRPSPVDFFDNGADSATKTLRRILNLDLTDE